MSRDTVTILVASLSGVIGLAAFAALVLRPALAVYPTWWQKTLAGVLAFQILVAFLLVGLYLGLAAIDRWAS